jgi:hypothetical protein
MGIMMSSEAACSLSGCHVQGSASLRSRDMPQIALYTIMLIAEQELVSGCVLVRHFLRQACVCARTLPLFVC